MYMYKILATVDLVYKINVRVIWIFTICMNDIQLTQSNLKPQ